MTFLEAAESILQDAKVPLHYEEVVRRALAQKFLATSGKTPAATLNSVLTVELKTNAEQSHFVRVQPGVYGLREWNLGLQINDVNTVDAALPAADNHEHARRVRIPLFPSYAYVHGLLSVLNGLPRANIQGLLNSLVELRGTPQEPEDWSDPDDWIERKLQGNSRDLAKAIWDKSHHGVNPRHLYGSWYLAKGYGLIDEDTQGILHVTERGQDFLTNPTGEAVTYVDQGEGLIRLLGILVEKGAGKRGQFLHEWTTYLQAYSNSGTDSTFKDTLRRRLANLVERGLVTRSGNIYQISPTGLAYLEQVGRECPPSLAETSEFQALYQLAEQQRQTTREKLARQLSKIDPFQFEHLIRHLLEEMGYQNVEVTSPTNDKGVDVVANIELGITAVREVIQVKRHAANIQRPVLDALRGSLHRFGAVRGTIITTGDFSKGTKDAAFEAGAAPITLINGQKLIELLIEYGLGVHKKTIEVWELDEQSLTANEGEETE
jgi:restriction system protein